MECEGFTERRLVHTPNLDRNIRFHEDNYLVQSKILSVLTIPLIYQEKAIGTLNLGRRPRKGFAKAEINLLKQIIPQICLSIVCARPNGQVRSAQSALEQNYRILFDHASDAIFIIDPDTRRIVEGNQRAEFMTGFSSEELRKMAIDDLIEPEERSHVQDFFKTLIKEKKVLVGSFPSRRKDGSRGEVEISACLIEH